MGHKIGQQGIRPLQDKLEAITKIHIPKNEKETKSFLEAIQYLSKSIEHFSANTDIEKGIEETKQLDLDERVHQHI